LKKTPKIFQKMNTRIPLPSLPQTLFQMVRVCSDPDCPPEKIARTAITDPALTLKLLQVAGQLQPPSLSHSSIRYAAETLGPRHLKNLAATRLMNVRTNPLLQEFRSPFHFFWLQSLCCALLAENLAKEIQPEIAPDAYLAGLLHDCGALLLWAAFGKKFETIRARYEKDPDALHQSETEAFGADRFAIGRYLLQNLNVHPFITEAVFNQRCDARKIDHALPLTQTVYTAARICRRGRFGDLSGVRVGDDLPFDEWTIQQATAKTDLQMERRLQEMLTSSGELLEEAERPSHHFLPADISENFHVTFSVPLALQAADAATGEDIQERLQQALLLFFEITPVRFFYHDSATDSLIGRAKGEPLDIDGLRVPLTPRAGLMAQAMAGQTITDSFGYLAGESQSVIDREIIALLGTEGILCIPLIDQRSKIGVICAGANESQMPLLLAEMDRLEAFGRQASAILGSHLQAEPGRIPASAVAADLSAAARRVIHEVNTPLSIIKNYLALLSTKIEDSSEAHEDIRLIREEVDRIPGIIGQLHRGAGENRKAEEAYDVNETIEDLIRLLEKSVFKDAQIRLQFLPGQDLPKFYGKKNHLLQVLTNLLKNSAEAMSDGGTIVIATHFLPPGERVPGRIRISLKDDGPGVPPEVLDRVFEPGTSTKGPDHFGLGLSICKDIVELYGGTIHCTSSPGRGAMFRIHLPVFHTRSVDGSRPVSI